jgi:hypothetical protein
MREEKVETRKDAYSSGWRQNKYGVFGSFRQLRDGKTRRDKKSN